MLYYDRIDISKGIDLTKSNNSKECLICHYWFFNHGFEFQDSVCDGCHDLLMLCLNISDIAIITIKNNDYHGIIHKISKSEAINLFKKSVLEDQGYIHSHKKNYGIYKKYCLKFQSIQSSFFYFFCLVCIKWLIVWTSISLLRLVSEQ